MSEKKRKKKRTREEYVYTHTPHQQGSSQDLLTFAFHNDATHAMRCMRTRVQPRPSSSAWLLARRRDADARPLTTTTNYTYTLGIRCKKRTEIISRKQVNSRTRTLCAHAQKNTSFTTPPHKRRESFAGSLTDVYCRNFHHVQGKEKKREKRRWSTHSIIRCIVVRYTKYYSISVTKYIIKGTNSS